MPTKLVEKRNELKAKQDKLHAVLVELDAAGGELSKVASLQGDVKAKSDAIKLMNKELSDLGSECDGLVELEKAYADDQTRQKAAEEAARQGLPQPRKDVLITDAGKTFVDSPQYKGYLKEKRGKAGIEIDVPLKVLMTTAAGFAPMSLRTGEVIPFVRRPPSVLDLIPVRPTSNAAVVYMEQTTRMNLAAEATEGAILGEAALAYTQRTIPVENVGTWMPVTGQQLEDVDQIQGIINDELTQMLRERIDSQILNGAAATPPSLQGILANAGIQTRGFAGDYFDTSFNAAKDIRVTGRSTPSAYIFHPNDWGIIRLARTTEGIYILGNPNEPVDRLWGLTVVQTDAIAEKTSLCGAFADWIKLYEKRGVVVEMSDSEGTNFSHFIFALRATVRVSNVILRPVAFCRFTRP